MEKIKYKMSARTTILLGRESVSRVDGAIIELIKNTYDADATNCLIYFNPGDNRIYILDDGTGMNRSVIENCWMMIGTDNKKINFESKRMRIKSGEKGIGRFALDRLGSKCEMFTKSDNNKLIHWVNDWNNFEVEGKSLDEVEAGIEELSSNLISFIPSEIKKDIEDYNIDLSTGTLIVIENLRDDWNEKAINKIVDSLSTILPPTEQNDFNLYVKTNITVETVKLDNTLEDDYDYKLISSFDGERFNITIYRNEFDLRIMPKALFELDRFKKAPYRYEDFEKGIIKKSLTIKELVMSSDEELINKVKQLGAFKFNYIFMKQKLQNDPASPFYYKAIGNRRTEWIKNHFGVKIYRDNFAVRPYGNKDSDAIDWLGLDARRSKDPTGIGNERETWHVSNAQGQGTLFISRVNNSSILDKSSREGIIENNSFLLLKEIIKNIISQFEKDRSYIGHTITYYNKNRIDNEKIKNEGTAIAVKINKESKKPKNKSADEEKIKLAQTVDILSSEKDELISENKLLRSLATNGLITTSIVHDLKTIQGVLVNRASLFEKAITNNDKESIKNHLYDLKKNDLFMRSWISVITNQKKDKRSRKNNNFINIIKYIVDIMKPILAMKNINISLDCSSVSIIKKCFINDIESIVYNLIINSVEAFEQKRIINREIHLKVESVDEKIVLTYHDNGPGLDSSLKDPYEIFKYGVTTKKDLDTGESIGTGLGMYIVDCTVREYSGTVLVTKYINEFELKIEIPE